MPTTWPPYLHVLTSKMSLLFVFAEQKCKKWTYQEISGSTAAKVFPYYYHCCGLCDWSCFDGSCNLPHDEKVRGCGVIHILI